jgi:hypothetical protein
MPARASIGAVGGKVRWSISKLVVSLTFALANKCCQKIERASGKKPRLFATAVDLARAVCSTAHASLGEVVVNCAFLALTRNTPLRSETRPTILRFAVMTVEVWQ